MENNSSKRHDSDENAVSRFSAEFGGTQSNLQNMESLVPSLKKKDLANMQPDERDEGI